MGFRTCARDNCEQGGGTASGHRSFWQAYLDLQEVLGGPIELLEALRSRVWQRLHGASCMVRV